MELQHSNVGLQANSPVPIESQRNLLSHPLGECTHRAPIVPEDAMGCSLPSCLSAIFHLPAGNCITESRLGRRR
jgi:hypothetical protein